MKRNFVTLGEPGALPLGLAADQRSHAAPVFARPLAARSSGGAVLGMRSSNARVQTFCDGVYAIAITLLVLNLKVPPHDSIHSVADLWYRLGMMWPSWCAFLLTFLVLSISWTNHHMIFSTIEGSTSHFTYANCLFLLTVVVLPFATALLGEYLNTEYAQPAVVFSWVVRLHFGNRAAGAPPPAST